MQKYSFRNILPPISCSSPTRCWRPLIWSSGDAWHHLISNIKSRNFKICEEYVFYSDMIKWNLQIVIRKLKHLSRFTHNLFTNDFFCTQNKILSFQENVRTKAGCPNLGRVSELRALYPILYVIFFDCRVCPCIMKYLQTKSFFTQYRLLLPKIRANYIHSLQKHCQFMLLIILNSKIPSALDFKGRAC